MAAPVTVAPASPMPAAMPTSCSNPNALGISRVVEVDTTGGPGFRLQDRVYEAEVFSDHDRLL
jgi:hypothetical protein